MAWWIRLYFKIVSLVLSSQNSGRSLAVASEALTDSIMVRLNHLQPSFPMVDEDCVDDRLCSRNAR